MAACSVFLLAGFLSSIHSACAFGPPLFADFAGTTNPSDFLTTFILALPPETFTKRSVRGWGVASLPRRILTGFDSLLLTPHGALLRRLYVRCAPIPGSRAWNFDTCTGSTTPPCPPSPCRGGEDDIAFPLSVQGRHTGLLISEFNGWPASPRTRPVRRSFSEGGCYTRSVTAPSVGLWPKSMAGCSL